MSRRIRNFKQTIKRLSCIAAIAPLVGGTALNLAIPFVAPQVAQVQAIGTDFIPRLQQMQLSAADFRYLVCRPYFSIWSQVFQAADSLENMCAYLVAQPGFYDQQVRTYEMRVLSNTGEYQSYYVYNLYGATYQTPAPGSTFPVLPYPGIRDQTGYRGINYSSNPVITSTFTYASTNPERQTMPIPAFTYPSWFTPQAQSQAYVMLLAVDYHDLRRAGASDQITSAPASWFVIRTGSLSQALSIPYSLSGTATVGSDYEFVTPFPHPTNPATQMYIPAGEQSAVYTAQGFGVQNSTPSETVQLTIQVPAGYAQGTGLTDFGWWDALNIPTITFTANGATTIQPGSNTSFTITRSGASTTSALEVYYTIGGTASNGSDYNYLDGSTTIPAGQTSATVTITVPQRTGNQAIPAETITITPTDTNAYNPGSGLSYEIAAYNPSTVGVTASGSGTIQRGTSGGFTVNRSAADSTPLSVNYSLGGTATPGSDYISPTGTATTGTITIPAGQTSATIPISIPASSGTQSEPQETIVLTVDPGQGYSSTASSTLTIPAYGLQSVSLPAQGGTLTPGGSGDSVTITRSGDTSTPLTVGLTTGGTATAGDDYGQLPSMVTIPAGATSVAIPIRAFPQSGAQAEPEETVTLAIAPGSGYSPATSTPITYTIPAYSPTAAPTVTVSLPAGGDTTLTPGETTEVTFTRTGDVSQALPVNYTVGGTAENGTDYSQLDGDVVIPAGQSTATVQVRVPSDLDETSDGKTLVIDLAPGTGYADGTNTTITYTLDVPPANVIAEPEPEPLGVVVQVVGDSFVVSCEDEPCPTDIPITITTGGSAVPGTDYEPLDQTLTLPAGSEGVEIPIALLPDATGGRTIALELEVPETVTSVSTQQYVIEAQPRNSQPLAILTPAVDESIPGFTISRPGGSDLSVPLTLTYTVGGTAVAGEDYRALTGTVTIPAGMTSAEVPVRIMRSATAGRTITLAFDEPPEGYIFGNADSLTLRLSRDLIDRFTRNGGDEGEGDEGNGGEDNSDTDGGDNSSSSSALPAIAGLAGIGGLTALTTGVVTGEMASCPAQDLPVALMNLVQESGVSVASTQPVGGTPNPSRRQVHDQTDWTTVSFSMLPALNGTPADQSFTLGTLEGLNKNITLEDLMGESSYTLISSGLVGNGTTLSALSQTLYANAETIGDVEGLAEYLAERSGGSVEEIAAVSMDIVRTTPQLASLDLRQLPLHQVPGLSGMELDELPNWQQLPVARIPGMSRAPFSELFPCLGREERASVFTQDDDDVSGRER